MSIVTISRGSYSRGKEVAEKVARELGYECISRDALIEASEEFNVPEIKLVRAIHDAPSILERFIGGRKKYVAYIQAALLEHLQKDNVVYHGLGAPFMVKNVSHVLKVRIIAEMEDRVRLEMEREGISKRAALNLLRKDDNQRRKWSRQLYGIDTWNPSLYDIVIHVKKLTTDDAVDLICRTVGLEKFQTTPESQRTLNDLTIIAKVKAALINLKPDVEVFCEKGLVRVEIRSSKFRDEWRIRNLAKAVPGVKDVQIKAQEIKLT